MKILSCNNTKHLVTKILSKIDLDAVDMKINKFSDGEVSIKIHDDLYQKAVLITHQLFPNPNEKLLQLLFLINAVKRRGAKRIHVIIPYFIYSRMDHKTEDADFISASCIASLLEAAGLDTLITIDLHSSQMEGFLESLLKISQCLRSFTVDLRVLWQLMLWLSPQISGENKKHKR